MTIFLKNIKEFIIAAFAFFKQSAKLISTKYATTLAGNLDPFYIFGGMYLFKNFSNKNKMKRYAFYALPIILYAIIQTIILSTFTEISILKIIINVLKICLCIGVMFFVYENYEKIKIISVVKIFTYFNLFFLIIANTIGRSSFLWRLNDYFNDYTKTRLQMFFLEPSELGFHIAIIMIFLLGYTFIAKEIKCKRKFIIYFCINAISLVLAKPMGAVCILMVACGVMMTFYLINKPTKKKIFIYIITIMLTIIISVILVWQKNPIAMRVIDTFNRYRSIK